MTACASLCTIIGSEPIWGQSRARQVNEALLCSWDWLCACVRWQLVARHSRARSNRIEADRNETKRIASDRIERTNAATVPHPHRESARPPAVHLRLDERETKRKFSPACPIERRAKRERESERETILSTFAKRTTLMITQPAAQLAQAQTLSVAQSRVSVRRETEYARARRSGSPARSFIATCLQRRRRAGEREK